MKERFDLPQTRPLERVRRDGIRLLNLHPDSCREILGEPPFLTALFELRRGELPPEPKPADEVEQPPRFVLAQHQPTAGKANHRQGVVAEMFQVSQTNPINPGGQPTVQVTVDQPGDIDQDLGKRGHPDHQLMVRD